MSPKDRTGSNIIGIPSRNDYGDPMQLPTNSLVDLVIQKHLAQRAGQHYDFRMGTPEQGLYSWATKKELPGPGGRIALYQQPLHTHEYGSFQGTIPEGYGAGTVTTHDKGKVLVSDVTPDAIHFTVAHKRSPQRYVLVRPKEGPKSKRWLLVNTTPNKPLEYQKLHYKSIPPDRAEQILNNLKPGSSVQAKVDGASTLTKLVSDGKVEVASYRTSKDTGGPIIHTERVFGGRPKAVDPKGLKGTVLWGELYGERDGKVIPPQELGGILNATVANSLDKQKDQRVKLKNMLFDVQEYKGKPISTDTPYSDKLDILSKAMQHLPKDTYHLPPESESTPEAANALLQKILMGKHPLTNEGVVIHPPTGTPSKVKFTNEHDVYVKGVFPGGGKYKGTAAGGIEYATDPDGPVVGRVGTGISDELRRELAQNPNTYINRVARIKAQEQHPSGAYRAPVLLSFHEDYPSKTAAHAHDRLVERLDLNPSIIDNIQSTLDKRKDIRPGNYYVPIYKRGRIGGFAVVDAVGKPGKQKKVIKTVIKKRMARNTSIPKLHLGYFGN